MSFLLRRARPTRGPFSKSRGCKKSCRYCQSKVVNRESRKNEKLNCTNFRLEDLKYQVHSWVKGFFWKKKNNASVRSGFSHRVITCNQTDQRRFLSTNCRYAIGRKNEQKRKEEKCIERTYGGKEKIRGRSLLVENIPVVVMLLFFTALPWPAAALGILKIYSGTKSEHSRGKGVQPYSALCAPSPSL